MSIRGPMRKTLRTSSEAPIATATAGSSQTSETFQRRASTIRGCGRSSAPAAPAAAVRAAAPAPPAAARIRLVVRHAVLRAVRLRRPAVVPDELRVEGVGREHRQHDHRREREQARPGCTPASGPKRMVAASRTTT